MFPWDSLLSFLRWRLGLLRDNRPRRAAQGGARPPVETYPVAFLIRRWAWVAARHAPAVAIMGASNNGIPASVRAV